MTVIDKILNEWSFRCHDGIVDMKDPKKVAILNEILEEFKIFEQEEDDNQKIENELLNALYAANTEDKKKILALINKINSQDVENLEDKIQADVKQDKSISEEEIDKIEKYLQDKGLPAKETLFLVRVFTRKKEGKQLVDYFKIKHNFNVSNPSIFQSTKDLDPEAISVIYNNMASIAGRKAIGKEEYFMLAFYDNVEKRSKGDLTIDNKDYEVKGQNAMMANIKDNPNTLLPSFAKQVGVNPDNIEGNIWINRLKSIYDNSNKNNEDEFKKQLNSFLNSIYKTTFNLDKVILNKQFNSETLSKEIIKYLIDLSKTEDNYMFVSDNGDIKIIENKEALKKAIDEDEIKITAFSDAVPRLSYTKGNSVFDDNTSRTIKSKSTPIVDINKQNYKSLTSTATKEKATYISRQWVKDHPEYKKLFNDNKSHPLYKDFILLKPDADIEFNPVGE